MHAVLPLRGCHPLHRVIQQRPPPLRQLLQRERLCEGDLGRARRKSESEPESNVIRARLSTTYRASCQRVQRDASFQRLSQQDVIVHVPLGSRHAAGTKKGSEKGRCVPEA